MAAKMQFLVVAALMFAVVAHDPHRQSLIGEKQYVQVPGGMSAKDVASAFEEALTEEEPLLKEEETEVQTLHHKSLVQHHLAAAKAVQLPLEDFVAATAAAAPGTPGNMPDDWASDFEKDVTSLVLGLSKGGFGATPFGSSVNKIAVLIEKDMMPKVTTAHATDQDTLNRLAAEAAECTKTKKTELFIANKKQYAYKKASTSHKQCRGEEAALYTENVECHANWKARKEEKELKCKAYSTLAKKYGESNANKQIVAKSGSEDTESYIRRITSTICGKPVACPKCNNGGGGGSPGRGGGMLDDFLDKKKLCEDATARFNKATQKCKKLDAAWHDKRKSCNRIQDNMDGASCQWAIDTKDACEAYSECDKAKKESFRDAEKGVRIEEKDRKNEWKGLKRMGCIITAFKDGSVSKAEIDTCKKATHGTDHLIIKYPTLKDMEKCEVPMLYPNTAEYKRREFTPLPTLAKGKADSNSCTGVHEVCTTPMAGSPASCKCERVTMNGPYGPGSVVKCVNCIDVSKSTDKNSCPAGLKLFAPESRMDWDSFLKSTAPLRAPNWIVDVTRPQNGCGGCTTYVMNSRVKQQKSWTTSDNSPWWLRSTRYNEPNGDYEANCYLDLWHNPKDSSKVTFNDGKCAYHSKSYYCQSVKFSPTPKKGSPAGCTCKKLELNGKYSANFLIKCVNCIDVRRSKDKNSCPIGSKIFSPESRADWKTFIDSATSLRNPHWIIDVTRPQNGCGGCTKQPMYSKNAAQATWHTADHSPWWLRSTKYNEPNGDYTANCYLDLWHNPSNANSVTWNDGSCNYHSKSYYCQTVKTKKKVVKTTLPPWKIKQSWKLIMKSNGDPTFGFSSKYWTNDKTLNPTADGNAAGNAKYAAWNTVPFSKMRMCVGSPAKNCVEHKFTRDYANAKALFTAGYKRDTTLDRKNMLKVFAPAKSSYQDCPGQRPGFNIECKDGNKARWGFCLNCASQPCQNADSNDADAAIGIGLAGQATPKEMGAGWTNYFASGKGTCNANSMTKKQVYVWVFQNIML